MVSKGCIEHEKRLSHLETKCEAYEDNTKQQRDFILAVNKECKERDKELWVTVDRHERYFTLLAGGWLLASFLLGLYFTMKGH